MVSRGAKHALSRYLRRLPFLDVPSVVAQLLNCLVGFKFNPTPQAYLSGHDEFSSAPAPEWTQLDARIIQAKVEREVFRRFRFTLPNSWWNESCSCIVLLREVCLKLGFQLKARDYVFEKVEASASCAGKSKKANGTNGHKVDDMTFYPEDILNVVPIIKDAPLKVFRRMSLV
jgi:protein TIF31